MRIEKKRREGERGEEMREKERRGDEKRDKRLEKIEIKGKAKRNNEK